MTRVCIIGDSHTAALKKGWRQISASFPTVEPTFFATAQDKMLNLEAVNGALAPRTPEVRTAFARTSNGAEEISADFDLYILCGLGLLLNFAYAEWARQTHDGTHFADLLVQKLSASPSAETLARLRSITQAPIAVIATPFRGIPLQEMEWKLPPKDARRIAVAFNRACDHIASSSSAIFIPQPAETLHVNRPVTLHRFTRHNSGKIRDDRVHMNADYGAILLRNALELTQSRESAIQ